VLCCSHAVPGLPLVTAAAASDDQVGRLVAALAAVMDDRSLAAVRAALHITGVAALSVADYAPILEMGQHAGTLGYPDLM
jgi:ABC-type phosphate/phosphonate transport system substrate-binding protein